MERSEAQKKADMKYREKNAGKPRATRTLGFEAQVEEAVKMTKVISESGMTMIGFLRWAVAEYEKQNAPKAKKGGAK